MSKSSRASKNRRQTKASAGNKEKKSAAQVAAEAQAALEKEQEAIQLACWEEIQQVLNKHGCDIGAVPQTIPVGGAFALSATVVIKTKLPESPQG